jgi:signal transduction histidine kinase
MNEKRFEKINGLVTSILAQANDNKDNVNIDDALQVIKSFNRHFGKYDQIQTYKSMQDESEFFDSISLYGMTMLLSGHNLVGKEQRISSLLRHLDSNNHHHTVLKEAVSGIFEDILWMFKLKPESSKGFNKNRGENEFIFNQLTRIYKDDIIDRKFSIDPSLLSNKATLCYGGANEAVHILNSLIQNALYWYKNSITIKLVDLKDYPDYETIGQSDFAFIVSNDGDTIQPEKAKNLFKHGFSERSNGNGIGLMLSKRIGKKKHLHLSYDENNIFGDNTNFVLAFRTNDL